MGDPGNECITIFLLYRIQALLAVVVIRMRSKQVVFCLRALLSYGFKLVEESPTGHAEHRMLRYQAHHSAWVEYGRGNFLVVCGLAQLLPGEPVIEIDSPLDRVGNGFASHD